MKLHDARKRYTNRKKHLANFRKMLTSSIQIFLELSKGGVRWMKWKAETCADSKVLSRSFFLDVIIKTWKWCEYKYVCEIHLDVFKFKATGLTHTHINKKTHIHAYKWLHKKTNTHTHASAHTHINGCTKNTSIHTCINSFTIWQTPSRTSTHTHTHINSFAKRQPPTHTHACTHPRARTHTRLCPVSSRFLDTIRSHMSGPGTAVFTSCRRHVEGDNCFYISGADCSCFPSVLITVIAIKWCLTLWRKCLVIIKS